MSEPLSFEAVRDTLLYHAGQLPDSALPMCVRWALEEIDRLRAQLAALAPLQDLLKDVREDNDLRRAAEIGAARERGACAATCEGYARGPLHAGLVNESAVLHSAANKIRRRGPCLSPPLEEKELERLRKIEAAARVWQMTSTQQERIEAFKILNEALGLFSGSISAETRALKRPLI